MSPEEALKHIKALIEGSDSERFTPETLKVILELTRKGLAEKAVRGRLHREPFIAPADASNAVWAENSVERPPSCAFADCSAS